LYANLPNTEIKNHSFSLVDLQFVPLSWTPALAYLILAAPLEKPPCYAKTELPGWESAKAGVGALPPAQAKCPRALQRLQRSNEQALLLLVAAGGGTEPVPEGCGIVCLSSRTPGWGLCWASVSDSLKTHERQFSGEHQAPSRLFRSSRLFLGFGRRKRPERCHGS